MEKLKPCPFCGKKPKTDDFKLDDEYYFEVFCDKCECGMTSGGYNTQKEAKTEAVERWNKRVGE